MKRKIALLLTLLIIIGSVNVFAESKTVKKELVSNKLEAIINEEIKYANNPVFTTVKTEDGKEILKFNSYVENNKIDVSFLQELDVKNKDFKVTETTKTIKENGKQKKFVEEKASLIVNVKNSDKEKIKNVKEKIKVYQEEKSLKHATLKYSNTLNEIVDDEGKFDQEKAEEILYPDSEKNNTKNNLPTATKERTKNFNEGKTFDYEAFRDYFMKLLNEERAKNGLEPLELSEHLKKGTEQRTNEMAEFGHIRGGENNDKKHSRPDGKTKFRTAFDYFPDYNENKAYSLGENILLYTLIPEEYKVDQKLDDPEFIAKTLFDMWKKSPGHYSNMMTKEYKTTWIDVKIGEDSSKIFKDGKIDIVVGTQVFDIETSEAHEIKNNIQTKKTEYYEEVYQVEEIVSERKIKKEDFKSYEDTDITTDVPNEEIKYRVIKIDDNIIKPIYIDPTTDSQEVNGNFNKVIEKP